MVAEKARGHWGLQLDLEGGLEARESLTVRPGSHGAWGWMPEIRRGQ